MPKQHKVQPGDCFSSLAKAHGFRDYHSLYDHASNAKLKAMRPNPNQLSPNDIVVIPDKKQAETTKATTQVHKYVVDAKPVSLRVVLVDRNDKALENVEYALTVGSVKINGKRTDKKGVVESEIAADVKTGELTVKLTPPLSPPSPSPGSASASAGNSPPPYPPPINPNDFKDAENEAYTGKSDHTFKWTLAIGSLPSFNGVSGVQERLNNLGFRCDGENGTAGPKTEAAIKAFQKFYKLKQTGKVADVQKILRDKHDAL